MPSATNGPYSQVSMGGRWTCTLIGRHRYVLSLSVIISRVCHVPSVRDFWTPSTTDGLHSHMSIGCRCAPVARAYWLPLDIARIYPLSTAILYSVYVHWQLPGLPTRQRRKNDDTNPGMEQGANAFHPRIRIRYVQSSELRKDPPCPTDGS